MKVKFKVNAEWEQEVGDDFGEGAAEQFAKEELVRWIADREESLRDNPTGEIPDHVEINVSHEIIS